MPAMSAMKDVENETHIIENNDDDDQIAQDAQDEDQTAKEKLNQRREARRRKILENAKNRLERLNGRTVSYNTAPSSPTTARILQCEHSNGPNLTTTESAEFSDPEVEPDIIPQHMHSLLGDGGPLADANFESNSQSPQWEGPGNDMNEIFNFFQAPPVQERHVLIKARLHLIVSALISCIFAIFWRDIGFSIFIPAGICVITDLLFFREQKPLHPILSMIFMMFNDRLPPQAKNCLHILSIIQGIIVDLGVFVFSFCTMFYLIFICTKYSFTELLVIQ